MTVRDVQFGMQVLPLAVVVAILLTIQADQTINIAGLAGFMTAKDVLFGMRAHLPVAVAVIGLLLGLKKWKIKRKLTTFRLLFVQLSQ